MHEFSLAQGLVEQLLQLARQNNAARIVTVRVDVGTLSGIVTDSFAFGFEVLARENRILENAELAITEIEPARQCADCGATLAPEEREAAGCSRCGSSRLILKGGGDLILTQIEME